VLGFYTNITPNENFKEIFLDDEGSLGTDVSREFLIWDIFFLISLENN